VKCPKDPRDWHQTFQISPVGINESVVVDLEMICQCDCERPGNFGYEENSPRCNGVSRQLDWNFLIGTLSNIKENKTKGENPEPSFTISLHKCLCFLNATVV
jgi:hypothetical protein